MMMWVGFGLSVIGMLLTIWGAWILYRHSTPDLGNMGVGVLPYEMRQMFFDFGQDTDRELAEISLRSKRNRQGFALIMTGSIFQLLGSIASVFV
jgi:hypothetical protein